MKDDFAAVLGRHLTHSQESEITIMFHVMLLYINTECTGVVLVIITLIKKIYSNQKHIIVPGTTRTVHIQTMQVNNARRQSNRSQSILVLHIELMHEIHGNHR